MNNPKTIIDSSFSHFCNNFYRYDERLVIYTKLVKIPLLCNKLNSIANSLTMFSNLILMLLERY